MNIPKNSNPNTTDDSTENVYLCPKFHYAVELIGKRWTGAIINVLLQSEAKHLEQEGTRFHDIRSAIPELSDRMLSERLKELEVAELVIREVYPETPVRVEYRLTKKGKSLKPMIATISGWAQEWVV